MDFHQNQVRTNPFNAGKRNDILRPISEKITPFSSLRYHQGLYASFTFINDQILYITKLFTVTAVDHFFFLPFTYSRGTAASNAWVYSWEGEEKTSSASPYSTMRPLRITAIRSAM